MRDHRQPIGAGPLLASTRNVRLPPIHPGRVMTPCPVGYGIQQATRQRAARWQARVTVPCLSDADNLHFTTREESSMTATKKRPAARADFAEPAYQPTKDLRIPNATPEQVAKALLSGGAAPRPETKRKRKAS